MILTNISNLIEETELWSKDVPTKWHPPAGLFTKSSEEIANTLLSNSSSPGQASKRLAFYVNRAGSKIKPEDKSRFAKASEIIHSAVLKSHEK